MKVLMTAVSTLIFTVIFMVGCTAPQPAESDSSNGAMYQDTWHKMPDGRTVYCLYIEGNIGGYSRGKTPSFECDFAGATVHK